MKERQQRLSVSLPHELVQYAREQAARSDTSISSVVARAIKDYRGIVRRAQTLHMLALNEGLHRDITRKTTEI